jgi:hypothetical protein
MIVGRREVNRHAATCIDALQRAQPRLDARPVERQPMRFRNDEVRREQRDAARKRLAKKTVGLGVMLIAPAAQRDPGSAIDE